MAPLLLIGLLASATLSAAVEVRLVLPEQGVDDRLRSFAAQSAVLIREWEPRIVEALGVDSTRRPATVEVRFRDMPGVAHWDGKAIHVSTQWVAAHPGDTGLVVHELTHVLQRYRKSPGWFTEGLADYVRFQLLEQGRFGIRLDLAKMKPRDSYRVTGWFLAQAEQQYPGLVRKLHATAAAEGSIEEAFTLHCKGKTIDQSWTELAAIRK